MDGTKTSRFRDRDRGKAVSLELIDGGQTDPQRQLVAVSFFANDERAGDDGGPAFDFQVGIAEVELERVDQDRQDRLEFEDRKLCEHEARRIRISPTPSGSLYGRSPSPTCCGRGHVTRNLTL